MIVVANKKRRINRIQAEYPGAYILDITSNSPYRYGKILSPFYPHCNIPIPGDSRGMTATCVEAIWQGLKVFEGADIDCSLFSNKTMKNIKRTVRKNGRPLGHRFGVYSNVILNYQDARRYIYIPSYKHILDNVPEVHEIIERIKKKAETTDIVLLDYNLNPNNRDYSKPLSHAELVKMYIEGRYPSKDDDFVPYTTEELKAIKGTSRQKRRTKIKIVNIENEQMIIGKINDLILKSEHSAKEIIKLLYLDITTKEMQRILESIPNIKYRKEKRTIYYTLGSQQEEPQLF